MKNLNSLVLNLDEQNGNKGNISRKTKDPGRLASNATARQTESGQSITPWPDSVLQLQEDHYLNI